MKWILLSFLWITSTAFAGVVETIPFNPYGGDKMESPEPEIESDRYLGGGVYEIFIRHVNAPTPKIEIPFSISKIRLVSADGREWEANQSDDLTYAGNVCGEDMMPGQSLCYLYRFELRVGDRPLQEQVGGTVMLKAIEVANPSHITELSFTAIDHLEGIIIGSSVGSTSTKSLSGGSAKDVSTTLSNSFANSGGGCGQIQSPIQVSGWLVWLFVGALLLLTRRRGLRIHD